MAREKVELKGSLRQAPAGANVVGTPDANETVQITIMVRRRNPLPAQGSGPAIRRQDFAALYRADPADFKKIAEFAAEEGLMVVSTNPARRSVVVSGSLAR
jgi:kumamolisin